MSSEESLLKLLLKRQQQLKDEMFERPPASLEQLQNQLGRYQELETTLGLVRQVLSGREDI